MVTRHHLAGLPVLHPIPLYTHAGANTPAEPLNTVARLVQRRRPSQSDNPVGPPHYPFRGLLDVHSRSGLRARQATQGDLFQRLQPLRYLHDRSGGYQLERPVAGWESHPLRIGAFARRTFDLGLTSR